MRFLTGLISRLNSSPSASSTTSVSRASGSPSVSRGSSTLWLWLSVWWSCIRLHPFGRASLGGRRHVDRLARGWLGCRFLVGGDPLGDELGVVFHPADQGGPTRVLPGEAEEIEARTVGDAAAGGPAINGVDD